MRSIPLIRTPNALHPKRSAANNAQAIRPSSRRSTLAPPAQGGFRRAPKASERRGRCSVRYLFAGSETARSKVRSLAHGTGELGVELSPKGSIIRWVVLSESPSFRRRASRRKSRGLVQLLCPRPGKTNAKRGACKRRRCAEQRHTSELPGANHAPRLPREESECSNFDASAPECVVARAERRGRSVTLDTVALPRFHHHSGVYRRAGPV